MKRRFAIGMGTNVGERRAHLESAAQALFALAEPGSFRLASIYETPPVGPPQPDYFNSAVSFICVLSPREVLTRSLAIEASSGRIRRERWGPRTLDLDLLTVLQDGQELRLDTPTLTLPHPELPKRSFALAPLLEVMPELQSPYQAALDRLLVREKAPRVVAEPRPVRLGGYKGWTSSARLP